MCERCGDPKCKGGLSFYEALDVIAKELRSSRKPLIQRTLKCVEAARKFGLRLDKIEQRRTKTKGKITAKDEGALFDLVGNLGLLRTYVIYSSTRIDKLSGREEKGLAMARKLVDDIMLDMGLLAPPIQVELAKDALVGKLKDLLLKKVVPPTAGAEPVKGEEVAPATTVQPTARTEADVDPPKTSEGNTVQ